MALLSEKFYSTYASVSLLLSSALTALIYQHSKLGLNSNQNGSHSYTGLLGAVLPPTTMQIGEANTDPQNAFIGNGLKMLGHYIEAKREKTHFGEYSDVLQEYIKQAVQDLRDKSFEFEPKQFNQLISELGADNKVISVQNEKNQSIEQTLDQQASQLNQLLNQQGQQWDAFRHNILQKIEAKLAAQHVYFNEEETTHLFRPQSLPELLERFKELNLPLPIDVNKMDSTSFFKLKIELALHDHLNRVHTNPTDIPQTKQALLKSLASELKAAKSEAKTLTQTQIKEMEPISRSVNAALTQIKNSKEELEELATKLKEFTAKNSLHVQLKTETSKVDILSADLPYIK